MSYKTLFNKLVALLHETNNKSPINNIYTRTRLQVLIIIVQYLAWYKK